ncbi:MAG: XRE family transcriptional regulator, partial [Chloroflexota bacterium]
TAELAQLSGWMAYDLGLYGVAQRYYLLALHACREGSCPDLGAKVIGDMTHMSIALGQHEQAQALARTALYSLPRHASSLVRSDLLGLESRASSRLGANEAGNTDRSAQTCLAVWEEGPGHDPAPDWIHYMSQAQVDGHAADAYIDLALSVSGNSQRYHYAAKAEVHSLRARRARGDAYVRSRVIDEIRLARVRLAQGDPAESAAVGTYALRLAAGTRSAMVLTRLTGFSRELSTRYPGASDTGSFHEELRDYLRKAAPARVTEP